MDDQHDAAPASDPPPSNEPSSNAPKSPEKISTGNGRSASNEPPSNAPKILEKISTGHGRSASDHHIIQTPGDLRRPSFWSSSLEGSALDPTSPIREIPRSPTQMSEVQSPLNPDAADRVFPVRSQVSVDPTPTPMVRGTGEEYPFGMTPSYEAGMLRRSGGRRPSTTRTSSPGGHSDSSTAATPAIKGSGRDSLVPPPALDGQRISLDPRPSIDSNPKGTLSNTGQMNIRGDDIDTISEGGVSTDGGVSRESKGTGIESTGDNSALVTARFRHVITDEGHAVITGRDGDTLQRCEDEPIHIPGAVQSFGLLMALKEEAGKFAVKVVSENSKAIIGYSPQQLFALSSFLDILTEEQADNLLDHLDFIRDDESDTSVNSPEVFMITIRPPRKRTQKLWCAMHINDTNKDLIICEFELEDDVANPLVPPGDGTPEPPEDTLGSNPTPEEFAESTVNKSKPLRVLRSVRKKKGEAAAMEVFNVLSQVQEQLANAPNLELFLRVLIGVVKELTGFHRVMIYQFDQAWNGRVVAELVDPRGTDSSQLLIVISIFSVQ
jgi:hypothetical protein